MSLCIGANIWTVTSDMSLNRPILSPLPLAESFEAAIVDRRNAERQLSVFLSAKLMVSGLECPCRIQNLSSHGAKIETPLDLRITEAVTIEFRSDLIAQGNVRWRQDSSAGIEFADRFDIDRLLKGIMPTISRVKPRSPRYQCAIAATISNDDVDYLCEVIDISTSGLKVSGSGRLRRGDIVTVKVEALPPHKAKVIWFEGDHCGLKLQNSFTYDEIRGRLLMGLPLASGGRS